MTISIAPNNDPAVLPMGRNGTAGKTASIQKIAKATDPSTSFGIDANAIVVTLEEPNFDQRLKVSPLTVILAS